MRDRAYRRAKARQKQRHKYAGFKHWLMHEFYDVGSGGKHDTPRNRRAQLATPSQNAREWTEDSCV